ncbi:hypothetical protein [Pseudoalteromonas xiamenensis]
MMSFRNLVFCAIVVGILAAITIDMGSPIVISFMISLGIICILSKDEFNTCFSILLILLISLLELILTIPFEKYVYGIYSTFTQNSIIFSIHLLTDILLALAISNRKQLSIISFAKKSEKYMAKTFEKCYSDAPLVGIFILSSAFDFLAFIENLSRHLERVGVPIEIAERVIHIQVIYDHYIYIKPIFMALTIAVLIGNLAIMKAKARNIESSAKA